MGDPREDEELRQPPRNAATIMAEIKSRVKKEVAANRDSDRPFYATVANFNNKCTAGQIASSSELSFLNSKVYGVPFNADSIVTHRKGILGKLVVKLKRKLLVSIWSSFAPQIEDAREFRIQLVRLLNDFSKYVDARDASNFWELIRKLDYDIAKTKDRVDMISDDEIATIRDIDTKLRLRMDELQRYFDAGGFDERIKTLERVTSGLESIIAKLPNNASVEAASEASNDGSNYEYLLLENRSRGSFKEISKRLSIYPPYFKDASLPVLDIGSGRGELLSLFKDEGIKAYGVDLDKSMVAEAVSHGNRALLGDAIAHLRSLPDGSLGGVIAIQVVEHLTRAQLSELFSLCKKKVAKGGKVIFETINPQSLTALSSNFYRDLTHVFPLHPDTLSYAMSNAGIKIEKVRMLSPVPREARLRKLGIDGYMTPIMANTAAIMNRNIEILNNLLYGYQDYCVIGEA